MRRVVWILAALFLVAAVCAPWHGPRAQKRTEAARADVRRDVRSVTIPVTVRLPERPEQTEELHYLEALQVFEDGDRQEILATRGAGRSPMNVAVLIQDDLASVVSNEIKGIADFIRRLPPGSRVMVGYMRTGTLQLRQKFTGDLERAAKSLRIPVSSPAVAPFNPFSQTRDAIKRFESQPIGRRAILLLSDGVDTSRGIDSSLPGSGFDLQRAINEAQRLGVAVYSIYEPTGNSSNLLLVGNGQGSLNRLSTETGGRAFFQGMSAPVSIDNFLREVDSLLSRQFALTYLSTHPEKGFHKVRVVADVGGGELYYPNGYTR